ncbi:hypothetical protein BT69DRAFT_1301326 [Atractiella rhizophila]|nr:hypothetical protein BT69DRAFT_1301326 [Atractiella rhizophila]
MNPVDVGELTVLPGQTYHQCQKSSCWKPKDLYRLSDLVAVKGGAGSQEEIRHWCQACFDEWKRRNKEPVDVGNLTVLPNTRGRGSVESKFDIKQLSSQTQKSRQNSIPGIQQATVPGGSVLYQSSVTNLAYSQYDGKKVALAKKISMLDQSGCPRTWKDVTESLFVQLFYDTWNPTHGIVVKNTASRKPHPDLPINSSTNEPMDIWAVIDPVRADTTYEELIKLCLQSLNLKISHLAGHILPLHESCVHLLSAQGVHLSLPPNNATPFRYILKKAGFSFPSSIEAKTNTKAKMKKLVLKNKYRAVMLISADNWLLLFEHAAKEDTSRNEDYLFDNDRNMVGNNEDEIRDGIGDGRRKRGFSQLSISPDTQSPPRKVMNNFKPLPDHSTPSSSLPKSTSPPPQLVDHSDSDALPLLSPTLLQFEERKQGSALAADDLLPPCLSHGGVMIRIIPIQPSTLEELLRQDSTSPFLSMFSFTTARLVISQRGVGRGASRVALTGWLQEDGCLDQKEVVIKKWIKLVGVGKKGKGITVSWNLFEQIINQSLSPRGKGKKEGLAIQYMLLEPNLESAIKMGEKWTKWIDASSNIEIVIEPSEKGSGHTLQMYRHRGLQYSPEAILSFEHLHQCQQTCMLLGLKAISKPEHSLSSPKASGSGSGIQDEGNHEDEQKEDERIQLPLQLQKKDESLTIIPKGKEKGWPSSVNWADFVRCCKLMVEQKLENMDDLGNLFMFKQVQDTFGGSLQTRLRDKQWQYNSDHLFGAGYYGPQGASIIESTLRQEWQSDSIDS